MDDTGRERADYGTRGEGDTPTERAERAAEEAHGGSMAPGVVDALGHPLGDDEQPIDGPPPAA